MNLHAQNPNRKLQDSKRERKCNFILFASVPLSPGSFRWGRKRHEQDFHSCAGNKVQHHLTFVGSAFGCVFTTSSTRATTSPLSRCVAWASSENILLHQRVAGVTLALRGRSNCTCTCKRRRTQECKARTACLMISLDWSLCFVCVCVCVCLSVCLSHTTSIPQMLYRTTNTLVFISFCVALSLSLFSFLTPHVVHRKQAVDRAKRPEKGTQTKLALGIIIAVAVR